MFYWRWFNRPRHPLLRVALAAVGAVLLIGVLVFGFFAFLLVRGFFNRSWWQILLSVVLFMAYGSILFGVLPTVMGFISWQAHLGGAIGGIIAAILLRPKLQAAT